MFITNVVTLQSLFVIRCAVIDCKHGYNNKTFAYCHFRLAVTDVTIRSDSGWQGNGCIQLICSWPELKLIHVVFLPPGRCMHVRKQTC